MDTISMNHYKSACSTPRKSIDSPTSPNISRYGRTHKPKMQDDYVSTDKKVSAYLKLSPGNQIQFFSPNEPKKKTSPKKSEDKSSPRRGRPPKSPSKDPKSENVLKMDIKLEPQDPNSPVEGCEWMVGDLAWARVGGHPFWPCVIAIDPIQKIFTKTVRKGRTIVSQRWVHVQFFGDNGRRSWLNSTAIMCYNGRDAFIQLGDTILAGMRKKEPKQTSAFVIKPAVIQVWEKAVQEAEDVVNASREERIAFFVKNFPPEPVRHLTRDELIEKVMESTESPPAKRGRKRKAEQSPLEEEIKKKQIKLEVKEEASEPINPLLSSTPRTIADRKKRQALLMQLARSNQPPTSNISPSTHSSGVVKEESRPATPHALKRPISAESSGIIEEKKPKKKYVKKKLAADYQAFCSKHFDRVSDDHPELNEKEINKYLQKMWNEMDDTQKSKYRSRLGSQEKEENESAEETSEDAEVEEVEEEVQSSKSSSPAPLATATQKPTATKRNNVKCLFSGAKAEKVCQICERTGDTLRCRGPCQGFYHPDCITNPPVFLDSQTATPTSAKKGKKRGRPKKSLGESPLPANKTTQPEEQNDNGRLPLKEEGVKESEEKVELNRIVGKTDDAAIIEVIEPEVKTGKVRKGSKDSESGSSEEGEGFRCKDCQEGRSQPCFVCHEYIHKKSGEAKLYRCVTAYCGKVYHEGCLKPWPQTSWRSNGSDRGVLTCPQHTCHTCASDNPGVIKARYSNDKLVRCMRCPTTYHYGNYCLPAGSEILTNTQIICPQHYQPPKKTLIQHVNAAWCFICASGGSLICCDLCPTSFHADCLNISTPPDGSYVCEDCQTGRFPLYGEIVWVKLGTYRWWPAEILYPAFIPDNILNLPHVRGEFAVKFFGSHDHYWVNRGRVFLYQDGDTAGKGNYKKSSVDNVFERAVKEASEAQRKYLEVKATRDAETRPGMKPPNYVKLKTNRPVGSVRTMDLNVSSLTPCECDPKSEAPCAPDSDCLNRILMVECHPLVCPAGEKCRNQLFEKRLYPPLQPYHTQGRGWGLKTLVALKKGDFVIEYVGEMIDEEEYKKRLVQMHANNEENYYFLTIDKDRMLDAGPKGNVARFMNHSCQPNCETQKWTVNGDTRVGLFALCDIQANTELVFNYNLESIGSDKKPCMCGAPNCSGFIGVKVSKNQDKEETKEKKTVKKKKTTVVSKTHEEDCFICGEGGELLLCDGKHCTKGYHLTCLGKKQRPQGYWLCPWHQCNICNKGRVRRCTFCVNSFCQEHSDGNIRLDPIKGLVCTKHDQENTDSSSKEVNPDESTPMEIDKEINDNSSTVPRPDVSIQIELINNNVIKTVTPGRRSQRSKSDTPRTEKVLNGAVQKVTKRKARPTSIDDKLIASDKTEQKDASSLNEEISGTDDSRNDVEELLNEILNTLPLKETVEGETEKITELEDKYYRELSEEEVGSEIRDNVSHNPSISNEVLEETNVIDDKEKPSINDADNLSINDTEKLTNDVSDSCKSHSEEENPINELTNGLGDTESDIKLLDVVKSNPDEIKTNIELEKDLFKEKELKKDCELEDVLQNNSLNLSGSIDDLQDSTKSTFDSNKIEEVSIKENCISEQPDNHNNLEGTCLDEENNTIEEDGSCDKQDKNHSDKDETLSEELNSEKHNSADYSEEENKEKEIDSKRPDIRSSSINKIKGENEKDNQAFTTSSILDVDDHVDDFELSYSEYSNDKLYKSINHSESSLEMKLTDCTSSENSENEQISNKIEQINSKNELVNCIEQSSAMEVA